MYVALNTTDTDKEILIPATNLESDVVATDHYNNATYKVVDTPNGKMFKVTLQGKQSGGTILVDLNKETAKTGKITVEKQDKATQVKLATAEFDVKDASGTVVEHVITGNDGTVTTKELPLGVYTLTETKAPSGYKADTTPLSVTVQTAGDVVKQVVYNIKIEETNNSKIVVSKFDKQTNYRLSGMTFTIRHVETNTEQTIEMKEYNIMEILNVLPGTYEIKETIAPKGYDVDPRVYTVKIETTNDIKEVNVYDIAQKGTPAPTQDPISKGTTALPKTGNEKFEKHQNIYPLLIGGIMFIVLTSIAYYKRK